jgi:hypothetical protein
MSGRAILINDEFEGETLTEREGDRALLEIHSEPSSDTDQIGARD